METKKEIKFLIWTVVIFLTAFFIPVNSETLLTAIHSTPAPQNAEIGRASCRERV